MNDSLHLLDLCYDVSRILDAAFILAQVRMQMEQREERDPCFIGWVDHHVSEGPISFGTVLVQVKIRASSYMGILHAQEVSIPESICHIQVAKC